MDDLLAKLVEVKQGFVPIRNLANSWYDTHSLEETGRLARTLLDRPEHQARMMATLLLGRTASRSSSTLQLLRDGVSRDPDWRVQEMLAVAFDSWCRDIGYDQALPVIREWLGDKRPNVRRAASEGLRPWISRPWFLDHPEVAISLLAQLRADESKSVRQSAGNALRDISRKFPDLVEEELSHWDLSKPEVAETALLASRYVQKQTPGD